MVGEAVIVGVTVDIYAMVVVSVDSGYQRSGNTRSENTRGADPAGLFLTCAIHDIE